MEKTAGIFDSIAGTAKALADASVGLYTATTLGVTALGGLAGWGIARATSPSSVAENSDKELEREALETEIDVTQRRIAALMERKEQLAKQPKAKPYDRFV